MPVDTSPAAQSETITAQQQDLSIFNFTSSSQDSGSSSQGCNGGNRTGKKRSTKKTAASRKSMVQRTTGAAWRQTKQRIKKQRLEAINKQWGLSKEVEALKGPEQSCAERAKRKSKRVSFLSPAVTADELQSEVPQESANDLSPGRSTTMESPSGDGEPNYQPPAMLASVLQQNTHSVDDLQPNTGPDKQRGASPSKSSSEMSSPVDRSGNLETTPKRPKVSSGRSRKSLHQISPRVLASPGHFGRSDATVREEPGQSPSVDRTLLSPHGRPSTGSPAVMKRNHKGETLLHLAAIKVLCVGGGERGGLQTSFQFYKLLSVVLVFPFMNNCIILCPRYIKYLYI